MSDERTLRYRQLFKKYCAQWPDDQKLRYLNIPNDRDEIDETELESAIELITEINGRKPEE